MNSLKHQNGSCIAVYGGTEISQISSKRSSVVYGTQNFHFWVNYPFNKKRHATLIMSQQEQKNVYSIHASNHSKTK